MNYDWTSTYIPDIGIVNDLKLQGDTIARLIPQQEHDTDMNFLFKLIYKNEISTIKAQSCVNAKKQIEEKLLYHLMYA